MPYVIHICDFSVGRFMARSPSGKQTIHFEDSNQFGPSKVDMKTGDLDMIPEKHWFWRLYQPWLEAGRPTEGTPIATPCGLLQRAMMSKPSELLA